MVNAQTISTNKPSQFLETSLFLVFSAFDTDSVFSRCCLFLFIVLCPVQDFFLQATPLRNLGMSPAIFPLCILLVIEGARRISSTEWHVSGTAMIILAYVGFTAAYGLLVFGLTSHHGENLLWKGATSLSSLSALLLATQLNYGNPAVVRWAVYVAFALVVLGFLLGNSNPLGLPPLMENGILHYTPLDDARPRGLANEPNQLSLTAIALGLLAVHLTRSRLGKVLFFFVTIGLLIATESKGGILTLFICVTILTIIKWHSRWYEVVAMLFVLFPLGLVLIWLLPNLFPEDSFALTTTVPTRFSMVICAFMTVAHNPLGVGVTGFLPAVAKYLPNAMSTLESIFPFRLNYSEVAGYLDSAEMISTKTFFFDQLMRFGVPFAICFFFVIIGLLRRLADKKKTVLFIAILACTIAIATYHPGIGVFSIPVVFGIALHEVRNGPDPLRCE